MGGRGSSISKARQSNVIGAGNTGEIVKSAVRPADAKMTDASQHYEVEVRLPKYQGVSEKQENYANNIARRKINSIIESAENNTKPVTAERVAVLQKSFEKQTGIPNASRSQMINYLVTNNPTTKSLLDGSKTAKQIIDQYA